MGQRLRPPILRWSTDQVPASQRFDYFANALASSLLPMRVSSFTPDEFDVELAMAELGPISVLQIQGCAHRAERGKAELARSLENSFSLIINLASPCNLSHEGDVPLRLGDATLVDSRFAHDFELGPSHRHVHLKLTEAWLRQWIPTPGLLVGRTLPRDSGWGRALTTFAAQLTPEFVVDAPLRASVLADQVGALLALTAGELGGGARRPTPRDRALGDRIKERIVQRSGEVALSAASVAASLDVSLRTLHRALTACGSTFGALLIDARADVATRMLESPLLDRLTIEEIGRRAGFSDASHFARVMRSRTGQTPREIRGRRGTSTRSD